MDLKSLSNANHMEHYSKGDVILEENSTDKHHMYILLKGTVAVYMFYYTNSPLKLGVIHSGEMFGEMNLFNSKPCKSTIVATEDIIVLALDRISLTLFINDNPNAVYQIIQTLCERMTNFYTKLETIRNKLASIGISIDSEDDLPIEPDTTAIEKPSPMTSFQKKTLFPDFHQSDYHLTEPEVYSKYIFFKDVTCPICGNPFPAPKIRTSFLKPNALDNDLRSYYEDFDPLWYTIWTCHHCYYSNFFEDFSRPLADSKKKVLLEMLTPLSGNKFLNFYTPQGIEDLFAKYYILLKCIPYSMDYSRLFARAWLHLSWLYKDVGAMDEYIKASSNAKDYYQKYYASLSDMTPEEEQRCCIILADLNCREKNIEKALIYLNKAANLSSSAKDLSKIAAERIKEINVELK